LQIVQCEFAAKEEQHAMGQRGIESEKRSTNGSDRRQQNNIQRLLRPSVCCFRLGERA